MAEFFSKVLSSDDQRILESLPESISSRFYMAGGTALALQIGHRCSHDLDFFTDKEFDNHILKMHLNQMGQLQLFQEAQGTVEGMVEKTRVTFLYYPYPRLEKDVHYQTIRLASLTDIALMKISALSSRGSRKDFIDLYFLKNYLNLEDAMISFEKKFKKSGYNLYHIIKSFAFFDNADKEPMPTMLQPCEWSEVKEYFNEVQLKLADRYL
jgi:hypothetical protein